jgi:hypothetical protein
MMNKGHDVKTKDVVLDKWKHYIQNKRERASP